MPDQAPSPLPQDAQQSHPPEQSGSSGRAGPAIRTMSSDIDELLKTGRPTISQIMTKEAPRTEYQPARVAQPRPNIKGIVIIIFGVLIIGGITAGGVWYFLPSTNTQTTPVTPGSPIPPGQGKPPSPGTPPSPPPALIKIPPPPPLFSTDASRTITIPANDRSVFLKLVTDTMQEPERPKTLKRILIKLHNEQNEHYANLSEFFDLWHIVPPPNFLQHVDGSYMFLVFYGADGPRIGFAARTRDSNRTLSDIFFWEQSLVSDLKPFFFQEQIKQPDPPLFEDRTSSNTDWRYLKLSTQKDLGIGYMVFQANRLVLFATSKASMESIIKTLYGTQ